MIIDTIWHDFLKIVREEVGSRVVETWFKAVILDRWDAYEKVAYLRAPNLFVKDWISAHYKDLFRQHLGRLLNEDELSIVFLDHDIASQNDTDAQSIGSKSSTLSAEMVGLYKPAKAVVQQNRPTRSRAIVQRLSGRVRGLLNEQYQFETFVVGPSNQLAFSAARAAAENPGNLYNPLFIYGGSGLGKTHLLHAVGNQIRQQQKDALILYQSADRFVNEFINAIRFNKVYQFEARYKDVDVLLIDDIQFISNKEQTQEAFFHIFNMLHQAHKQIVFTSDSMPCDIVGLAERMRSRLEGGLIADIQLPSLETMIAIVQRKSDVQGKKIPEDVAYFIASRGCSNVRELEGMLIRVAAYASLTGEPITIELAQKILLNAMDQKKEGIGLREIAMVVAKHFDMSLQEMRSSKRHKELARARHIAMYLMKELSDASLREIGKFFARKDHSTVIHAHEKIKKQCELDSVFMHEIKQLEKAISQH